ncbi:MAG TPA: hypothetical protein VNA17_10120 [Pyrinomonadaceae bacterium]|nr:hypothetical protein [Pyrinomonadaceae bacterium]
MKRKFVFAAIASLFVMAVSVSAQKAPADFSGKWNLDLAKSKLTDREKTSIESQTWSVTQTATEIKIEPSTKRTAPPAGAPAGGGGGGRMGGGGGGRMGGGGGDMASTYPFGKETTVEQQMGPNTVPVTMGSKWDGSKLVLWRSSVFNGPNGEVKNSSKETWELGADGKTLTVTAERSGMQGPTTTTKVFTKG